jgi:hypothetical protein
LLGLLELVLFVDGFIFESIYRYLKRFLELKINILITESKIERIVEKSVIELSN